MRYYLLLLLGCISFTASAQNLLVNGSFEDENICSEYKEPCAPEGWLGNTGGFKNYIVDADGAYDGSHYLTIEAGRTRNKYQRSYTRAQLLCNLRKGNKYRLRLFMKAPADILDSIGIYFTNTDFIFDKNTLQQIQPTAYVIDQNKPQKGNHNWQEFNFIYTANGSEKYVTIANFSKRDINGETGIPSQNHFFVYIDAVSLLPLNPDEKLCSDWEAAKTAIYEMNDRHEFFLRTIRFYRSQNKVATPPELSLTRIFQSKKLVLKDNLFIPGRGNLQNEGFAVLDRFCAGLSGLSAFMAEITTYADDTGDAIATDEISLRRGALVKEYIRRRLHVEDKNIKLNDLPAGRPAQVKPAKRRVEIVLYLYE